MELKEYFRIVGKHWAIFVLTFVAIVLGTYLVIKTQPKTYLASTTLTVNKASVVKQSQVNYYLYDNYYNVQSSQLFSQVVTSWFSSPTVASEIYQKAGLAVPDISQDKLAKQFKALRREPSTIDISLVGANRDEALKLVDFAAIVMQQKANALGKTDTENIYNIVAFDPIVTDNNPNMKLDLAIAAAVGLLFAAALAFSVEYFKSR